MAELIKEHVCETCDVKTYHARIAEPQGVRVRGEGQEPDYLAFADYVLIKLATYKAQDGKQHDETIIFASDDAKKSYPGIIFQTNRQRTLEEALWIVGGEYDENRTKEKVNGA